MSSTAEEFQSIRWWVITRNGGTMLKSSFNSERDGEPKYYILQGNQRHLDARSKRYFWLEYFKVFNPAQQECLLSENGITAKISTYDKTRRTLYCSITDINGVSKPVSFSGDVLAISKCINYMQNLSKSASWLEHEWKEQKVLIKKQKDEIRQLKQEVAEFKSILAIQQDK